MQPANKYGLNFIGNRGLPKGRMTPRRQELLQFLQGYFDRNGFAPTNEEMREAMGVYSSSTIHGQLKQLEAGGFIRCTPGQRRGIELIPQEGIDETPLSKLCRVIVNLYGVNPSADYLGECLREVGVRVARL